MGNQHPQIILGLLVSLDGYPLAYDIFKGNTYEGHTMLPVIDNFKIKYNLTNLIIVADAGLLTKKNVEELIAKNYKFILGARINRIQGNKRANFLAITKGPEECCFRERKGLIEIVQN